MSTKARILPGDGDPRHGTVNGYSNLRCRCEDCRRAWSVRFLRERQARERRLADDPTLAQHGMPSTYTNWRCRCAKCTAAWAIASRERKQGAS